MKKPDHLILDKELNVSELIQLLEEVGKLSLEAYSQVILDSDF